MPDIRLHSFIERYVIERAKTFGHGQDELQQAWIAVQNATAIYKMIQAQDIAEPTNDNVAIRGEPI